MLAAQPVVTVEGADVLLGDQANITVTFDNVPDGSPGSNTGYQPYIDLILPTNGVDGAGTGNDPVNDGVTFEGATYLGQAVQSTEIEFDVNGEAVHPFARDASGSLRVVQAADYGAQPGDTLVAMRLPFGSFTDDQPPAVVSVSLGMSNLADVNVPLTVSAVGGFAFGRDALDNPTTDAPVLGPTASDSVIPRLFLFTKTSNAPEGETATGPSFPRTYTLTLDVATGQSATNLVAEDLLADGIVFESASAGVYLPNQHAVVSNFGPLVGVDGVDRTWTITFHVGEFLAPGDPTTPVLDPDTGAPRQLENNVRGAGTWTPLDTRDPVETVTVDPPGPENVIVAKALAIQKTAVVLGPGQGGPGDTIQWTINVQVSDFFSLDALTLADVLSDGQHFDATFTPTLLVQRAGVTAPLDTFDTANFDAIRAGAITPVNFRVGDELEPNSVLTGGGSEGPPLVRAPTTVVITYRSVIDEDFVGTGGPVLQGDVVSNSINGTADIDPSGNAITDNSSDSVPIVPGEFGEKTIYAINGVLVDPNGPTPRVENGDVVTFRITYTMPITSANDFVITDFLPLPIFSAAGITFQDQRATGSQVPAAGVAMFGPTDTFDAANPNGYAGAPTVTSNVAANSVAFQFGSFSANPSAPTTIDLLFSAEVQDQPFGDGLIFDNLAHAEEANTPGEVIIGEGIADLILSQPLLNLQKGIVATTNGNAVFTPSAVAPVTFNAPGTTGPRFTGTISSDALDATDIDSDISNVDAGDLVTFAIVVENTGSDSAFDITISDILQAGYEIPDFGAGLNLQVTDGAGNLLDFTGDLFNGGITLTDDALGALAEADPASGANVLIITYDLRLVDDVAVPDLTITNTATIEHYAALEGGTDFAPNLQPDAREDDASSTTAGPDITKTVVETSQPASTGSNLLIGEEVTYEVVLTLSEGSIADLVLTDTLPNTEGGKITFLEATLVSVGGNITTELTPVLTGVDSNGDGILDQVVLNFGDTLNAADNIVNEDDQIVLRVRGLVDDLPQNNGGDRLTNTAVASFTDANGVADTIQDTADITIIEPGPTITKTVVGSTTVDGGDLVTYQVVVNNPASAGAPAFDLIVQDLLGDPDLSLVAGTVTASGTASTAVITRGNAAGDQIVTVNVAEIEAGESLTITYQVRVSDTAVAGDVLLNTASQQSDTIPGDVEGQREFRSNDSAQVNVARPTLVKAVTATGLPDTGTSQGNAGRTDLAFGETVTFTLTATISEGVTQAVVLLDRLPFDPGVLEVTSAEIATIGANLTIGSGAVVGTLATLSDRNGDGTLDTATFDLGDITNTPDGVVNAGDRITFTVDARLISTASASAGAVLTNQGQLSFTTPAGPGSATAQTSVEIVAPNFQITKTSDLNHADAGDEIVYTVRLTNIARDFVAPGYDVTLTDLVDDPSLALVVGSVVIVGQPSGANATITTGNTAGDTDVTIEADRLGVGETLIVQYRLQVDDLAPSGDELVNVVDFVADSHPGDQVGERDFDGSAAAVVEVDPPAGDKSINATSLTATGANQFNPAITDLAIGETVTYRITEALAEGTTSLVIVDNLPTDGVRMHGTAFRLVSVGDNITLSQQPILTPLDTNGDGFVDQLTIDFGSITNAVDNIQDQNDWVTIEIDAVVVDHPDNVQGDLLVNTAQTFVGGALVSTLAAEAEVVEPDVLITKDVTTPAGIRQGSASGDAGDEVTFTVTVRPNPDSMTGPAFNLVLNDLLTPGLELVAGSVTATRGTIVLGNGASDTQVRVTGLVLLPDDGVVTITYRAVLTDAVENGQVLTNTAELDYFSSPAADGQTPDVSRLYETEATSDVVVALDPNLDKSLVFTSVPQTRTEQLDPDIEDVNQGETVVYRLTIQLGEGTQNVTLSDVLPDGAELIDLLSVQFGANISGDTVDNGVPFTITGNTLTLDFGTLVNQGDNLTNAADQITVDVVARVNGDTAPGTQLQNDATLTVTSPSLPAVPPVERTATGIVEVVAPIPIITKTPDVTTGDAGDIVTYTVVASLDPASTGPLIHPFVSDPLGPGMALIAGSVTTTFGTVTTGNNAGDTTILVNLDPAMVPGQTEVIITYQVRLTNAVEPGQDLPNTATFQGDTTPVPNPDTATLTATDDALVTVVMPVELNKTVVNSSLAETVNPDVAVGERFTYRLGAALSEGTQRVVITDTIPDGLQVLAVRSTLPGFNPTITIVGQTVTADFGVVVIPGNNIDEPFNLGLDIDVVVLDVPGNIAGTQLVNDGVVEASSPTDPDRPGGTETDDDDTTIEIVEPVLVLEKTPPPGFILVGEDRTWTLVLSHDASSTSAAYDITLQDLLDGTELELVAGSVEVTRGTVVEGNGAGDTDIVYTLDVLRLGETVTITFEAHAADDTPPASILDNTATGTYDSARGPGGRPGEVEASASVPMAPDLTKTVIATSIPQTGSNQFSPSRVDLAIGETVTYRLVVTLPDATIDNLIVRDLLAAGLTPLGASVLSIGSGLTGSDLDPGDAGVVNGRTITFNFGDVTNAGDPDTIGAEDTIVILVTARAADVASNVAGTVVPNVATTAFNIGGRNGTLNASASIDIVEPQLVINKTVDHPTGDAGDEFTYTVTITHASDSTSAAFDLVLEDPLSPLLDAVSVSASAGTIVLDGDTVRFTLDQLLLSDAPVVLTYVVRLTDAIEPGMQVPNVATLDYDSAPVVEGRPDSVQDDALITGVSDIDLTKQVVATSIPQTGSGQFNPARPDLAIGETVTYQLTATLSEGTQRLVIRDTLPDGLVPLTAELVSLGTGVTAGQPTITISGNLVTFDFGTVVNTGNNIAGDGTVTVSVQARVADVPGNTAGHVLGNAALGVASSPTDPTAPGGTVADGAVAATEVVVPELVVDKSADKQFATIGEQVTYTVVLRHAPGSTAPAFDVVVDDILIPGVTQLVVGSVTTTAGTVVSGNNPGDTTIRVLLSELLLGQVVSISYMVDFVSIPLPEGQAINTAVVNGSTAPGDVPGERPITTSDDAEVQTSSGFQPRPDLHSGLFGEDRTVLPPWWPPAFSPIFAGTAQPGSVVSIAPFDPGGAPLGYASVLADVGGNWLAVLQGRPIGPQPDLPNTADLLANTAQFSDRDNGVGESLPRATPGGKGGVSPVLLQPFDLRAAESDPTPFVISHPTRPVDLTFHGPYTSGLQFDPEGLISSRDPAAGSLAWNRFARDFVAGLSAGGALQ